MTGAGRATTALRRRRRLAAATTVAGTGLLGASLASEPDSREFYQRTLATAAVWAAGGLASGPLHLGRSHGERASGRPVLAPVLTGAGVFGVFYGVARVARRVPVLDDALTSVLRYTHRGSRSRVVLSALVNGVGEELFFRGGLYDAVGARPVVRSTTAYVLVTTATRNPALVLASAVMGTLFALQRRATGGVQASTLTHLTWSALMLRYLPPLFDERDRR